MDERMKRFINILKRHTTSIAVAWGLIVLWLSLTLGPIHSDMDRIDFLMEFWPVIVAVSIVTVGLLVLTDYWDRHG